MKIYGILLDDYYIHKFEIQIQNKRLIINKNSISFQKRIFQWKINEILFWENTRIEFLSTKKLKIQIFNLNLIIKNSKNNFGIEHLDFSFLNFHLKTLKYGGLLGDIQEKNLSVNQRMIVQKNQDIFVNVNGYKIKGKIERRGKRECIFIPIEDLIKPKRIHDYIH